MGFFVMDGHDLLMVPSEKISLTDFLRVATWRMRNSAAMRRIAAAFYA